MGRYFRRGTDHLGFLNMKLRDLLGYATLAHELIQNADDAANTTCMSFDVRTDALVVNNDGRFSDCNHPEASTCPWNTDSARNKMCDFQGFSTVASGHKRVEENTTGAFGIGFTAVYQLTDRPELISSGRHWILDDLKDEANRIYECDGCSRCRDEALTGTRFILPWATEESEMRSRLGASAVKSTVPGLVLDELLRSIPLAMLFLKRLDRISILLDGELQKSFERSEGVHCVTVTDGTSKREWLILENDFDQSAARLRSTHVGKIENKRSSKIKLAIPTDEIIEGVFCAFLPTQQPTGLPFHINADFFPKSDRKGIIGGDDFQSAWNSEAIAASARIFCVNLEWIRSRVSPRHLWNLIDAVFRSNPQSAHLHKSLSDFPKRLAERIRLQKVVQTSLNQWVVLGDAVFLSDENELESLTVLEGLGLNVVHGDLRFVKGHLLSPTVGVNVFNSERLVSALQSCGMDQRIEAKQLPECLQSDGSMELLWNEVARLLKREGTGACRQLRSCAIAPARDGAYWPCKDVYQSHEGTISSFSGILPPRLVASFRTFCIWPPKPRLSSP